MDFQSMLRRVKTALISFWRWIKPYLGQFHRWRKRIWKKISYQQVDFTDRTDLRIDHEYLSICISKTSEC